MIFEMKLDDIFPNEPEKREAFVNTVLQPLFNKIGELEDRLRQLEAWRRDLERNSV